jgi:hypothetical protein
METNEKKIKYDLSKEFTYDCQKQHTFTNDLEENKQQFSCCVCNYFTDRKSNLTTHLNSVKHNNLNKKSNMQKSSYQFVCDFCDKTYKTNSGLWKHKKTCKYITCINNNVSTTEILSILKTLIKDNQEFTKDLVNSVVTNQCDAIKEMTKNGIINTTNNNSHNRTFNLNFFLNETCKNAMNISEFVDSIKLQLADLIKIGEVGYVEGISNIITSNLQLLDITERPIHCTDKKRETVYIKDEDKWEKDDDNKKLRKAIKHVAYKNESLLPQYKQKHPGCNYSDSKYSDQYSKLVIEAMGGLGEDTKMKEDKIIKNISKAVAINKEELVIHK